MVYYTPCRPYTKREKPIGKAYLSLLKRRTTKLCKDRSIGIVYIGNVLRCDSAQRKAVHLAAVFACNFSNHMYAIAAHLLESQGLSFDVMKLLIRETELKAEQMPPLKAQTGPAIRHDENVMRKHLALLEGTPEAELYRLISLNIERYGQNGNNNSNINPTTKP